jgi:hypothetical protein
MGASVKSEINEYFRWVRRRLQIMKTQCIAALASLALLLGCPTEETGVPEWEDERIDHGDEFNPEPESSPPTLCVSGNYVYVAWHDTRSVETNNIYLQVSQDGGDSWNGTDMRINSNPGGDWIAENPAIACAGASIYVVWEDDRDGDLQNKAIYFNASHDAGGDWLENDVNLTSDVDGDWNSMDPQVKVAGTHVHVSWYDGRDGAYDIYYTYSSDSGMTWLDETRVDTDDAGSAYSAKPRMAVDGVGRVHVVWEDLRQSNNDIYFNTSGDDGITWGNPDVRIDVDEEQLNGETVGCDPSESFGAAVDGEDEGMVAVAWHDLRNGAFSDIYTAVSLDHGATFSTPMRLDAGDGPGVSDSLFPVVDVVAGDILVAFRDDRHNEGFDVFFSRSTDAGVTFADEVAVDLDQGSYHSIEPQIVGLPSGDVVVSWIDKGNPAQDDWEDILYNYSNDGGESWQEEEIRVDDDERWTARSIGMQMAVQDGELFFAWADYRMGEGDIFFRRMEL